MKKPAKKKPPVPSPTVTLAKPFALNNKLLFLLLLSTVFYFNTLFNEYALDDFLVISKNEYTQKGIAGIPDLITKTSYYGFFKNNNEEATLRYRPVVMITYALECQFVKNKSTLLIVSHFINILIFLFTVAVLFRLFEKFIFKNQGNIAFMAVLLFVIHPIHTESVANIKGRDELMSLLFAVLSAWFLFKYISEKKYISYLLSIVFFLFGLFSKENTISFLLVLPLMIYFFSSLEWKKILKIMAPFILTTIGYIFLRFSITGWSHQSSDTILNNPFIHSGINEKYATIIWCLGFYLKLLFYPHPLSYDYTFNTVKLVSFESIQVWISLFVNVALLVTAIAGIKRKSILSFGILFYFSTLFLVTNIPVNLGALIGERLLYSPSVGFCIAIGFLLCRLLDFFIQKNILDEKFLKFPFLFLLILFSGYKTISRNPVWKNNFTLMTTDVEHSSESMKANDAAAIAYILATDDTSMAEEKRKEYLYKAITYDRKASQIMPSFTDVYFNLGAAFSRLEIPDSAEYYWNIARKQKPQSSQLTEFDEILGTQFLKQGLKKAVNKDMTGCLSDLSKSVTYSPKNTEAWYNYGGALYSVGRYEEAKSAFKKVLEIDPTHQQALQGFNSLMSGH